MATLESIDEVLATHQPLLPSLDCRWLSKHWRVCYSSCDRCYSWHCLDARNRWNDGLRPIIWEPIQQDAGAQVMQGIPIKIRRFTPLDSSHLSSFSKHIPHLQLPADDKMMLALIAWVCLAILRVLEDADFFPSSIDWLLISPIIHLHLATWLIGIGFVSHLVGKKWDGLVAIMAN